MALSSKERQARLADKRRQNGLIQLGVWIPARFKSDFMALSEALQANPDCEPMVTLRLPNGKFQSIK